MNGFIYIIKNTVNNKVYIGQTRNSVEQRWKEHLRHAQYGEQLINRAMKKYGIDKFYIETLETCSIESLDEKEMRYIELYDSTDKSKGYNVSIGGWTPKVKRVTLDSSEITRQYVEEQMTLEELAVKYNVTRWIITAELKNAGVTIRDRHVSACKVRKLSEEYIKECLQKGKTLRKAAKIAKLPYATFRSACIYHYIEYNSSTSARH